MGKVNPLCNRAELFAALFWALGNDYSQQRTLLAGSASPRTALHKACSYMVIAG